MASRITGSIIKSSSSTDTAVTISATGRFTYRSGTYGYTVDGYIQIGSSKKSFNDAKSSTSGGTFTAVTHSVTIPRTRVNQTITITLYGYCDEGSSEDKSTVTTTVVVPALPSYAVTLEYNDGETPIGNLTKWYGETLTLPTPARSGYTFLGWSDGTTNIGATYSANAAANLTAQWKINTIAPSITGKNCQRLSEDKTQASFSVWFNAGKNADGSVAPISSIKIEYKLSSESNWRGLTTILNPSASPITYTGGAFLVTETYSIRYTISDANYSGLIATDILTNVSYIWKAKKGNQGFDIGVPLTVNGESLALLAYPVGSIYMSVNDVSPAILFGGTWEQIKDKFLLSAGDTYEAGAVGGEATHTLLETEIPSHVGHLGANAGTVPNTGTAKYYLKTSSLATYGTAARGWSNIAGDAYPAGVSRGGGQAHNNMPPYLTVYMWKRIA